jgi:regulator of protease activity HflC (stomatin/prohibitin superfamily)
MGLIIFGLVILLIGIFGGKQSSPIARFKGLITLAGIVIIVIGVATSAIRQINPGQVGVQVLFGKVNDNVLYEGLNFVNPLVEVQEMTIKTQNYTMSRTSSEGQTLGDDAIRVLSKDGLEVVIDLTVLYKVMPTEAPNIYKKIGLNYQDVIIRPVTRTGIRESASYYDAIALFSEKREEFEVQIMDLISREFKKRGLVLENLLVRNIKLPESVEQSIERKITAVQEAQRMKYVLEKEEQEADRKRVEAQGNADAQRIVAQALTDKVLQFEMIKVQKELVNSPNSKIIVLGGKDGSVPFILGK